MQRLYLYLLYLHFFMPYAAACAFNLLRKLRCRPTPSERNCSTANGIGQLWRRSYPHVLHTKPMTIVMWYPLPCLATHIFCTQMCNLHLDTYCRSITNFADFLLLLDSGSSWGAGGASAAADELASVLFLSGAKIVQSISTYNI